MLFSLVFAATFVGTANKASAIPLSNLVGGGSITFFGSSGWIKRFDNWQVNTNAISGDVQSARTAFNLVNIDVAGDLPDAFNARLIFTPLANELTITQAGARQALGQLNFQFDVTELAPGFQWGDNGLSFTHDAGVSGATGNHRSAQIHEQLFTDATLTTPLFTGSEKDVHYINDDVVGISLVAADALTFPTGFLSGTVVKDITLETHSDGERVGITEFRQTFSQIPEPGTWALTGLGLLGIVYGRRRRRQAEKAAESAS